jgi:hypothetical protein
MTVRSGGLEIQGVDLLLEAAFAPKEGDWSAFEVGSGADLSLSRATVTVAGRKLKSSVIFVPPSEGELGHEDAGPDPAPAHLRAIDCLLRCGGDVADVSAGRRLDLELTNVVVGSGGSLVHAHGLARGQTAEPLRIVLRQVAARLEGGVAFLESAQGQPELPIVEVIARDVVVATNSEGGPLFRLDGQEELDALRDRVKWDGQGVQYHQIDIYRRDQTARPGTLPQTFDRPSWDVAVAPNDTSPFHGDVRFERPWPSGRSPEDITREDIVLDADGPSSTAGPDPKRIPPVMSSSGKD